MVVVLKSRFAGTHRSHMEFLTCLPLSQTVLCFEHDQCSLPPSLTLKIFPHQSSAPQTPVRSTRAVHFLQHSHNHEGLFHQPSWQDGVRICISHNQKISTGICHQHPHPLKCDLRRGKRNIVHPVAKTLPYTRTHEIPGVWSRHNLRNLRDHGLDRHQTATPAPRTVEEEWQDERRDRLPRKSEETRETVHVIPGRTDACG